MTEILIAPLAGEEIPLLARIHARCFDDPWSAEMVRRVLETAGAFGLAARCGPAAELAGFALGRVVVDECELLSLGVAPCRRRHGLGAALLDAAMDWAAGLGVRGFFLEVGEFNQAARRLYDSRGLVRVGRRRGYYELKDGGTMDALTMRCELDRSAQALTIRRQMSPARTWLPGASQSRAGSSFSG